MKVGRFFLLKVKEKKRKKRKKKSLKGETEDIDEGKREDIDEREYKGEKEKHK